MIETRLDQTVRSLVSQKGLESSLAAIPSWAGVLLDQANYSTQLAFGEHDPSALLVVHRSLKDIYGMHITTNPNASANQYNPFLEQVRQTIEAGWMESEVKRSIIDPDDISDQKEEFSDFFKDMVFSHKAMDHPLYNFLETQASEDHFREFFQNEYALNVRFFDIIILAALGTKGGARREVSENLWDESGNGLEAQAHTLLYEHLLDQLDITYRDGSLVDQMDWQVLAGHNLFLHLGLNRRNYHRFVGCLGATELMDPSLYTKFMAGCSRLGLDRAADLTYYTEHIEVDVKHGNGWIDNVMLPMLDSKNTAYEFYLGAQMRLNTSYDYYQALYSKLQAL